jgi:ankyrin repeat protein
VLHIACLDGTADFVQGLLDRGASVHAETVRNWCGLANGGEDALILACTSGNIGVVLLLLHHGADPDKMCQRWSALGVAAAWGHAFVCVALIRRGANLLATMPTSSSTALDVIGLYRRPQCGIAAMREELVIEWDAGPHLSQVRRRNWERRWPFVSVVVGSGFRPLSYRVALQKALALPPTCSIPRLDDIRLALLRDKVFTDAGLIRTIVAYI